MARLPLAGIRVTDFSWIGAGSYATKLLADCGADVVKIESAARLDSLRTAPPFRDGKHGVDRSGYFSDRNTSKRSLTLDMKHPKALGIVRRLIEKSDVVANNFTPGVMERFGLGYDAVRAWKPDIIYLAMSMQGATGPERHFLGYGASVVALTALHELSGYPDREPAGTGTNYPDHIPNPCHGTFAVLAALRHRRRTGEGQYIELAQTEPTVALLGPTILDLAVNGRTAQRIGNDHPSAAPHGVYPCAGDDRWIAICAMTDAHWRCVVQALGSPAWAAEPRWHTLADRHRQRRELDALLGGETRSRDRYELMHALQTTGVPAGAVQDARDVIETDPQLAHRGHWVRLQHAEMGLSLYNGAPFHLSRTPARLSKPAPLLGEHTREVCRELAGLSEAEIDALAAEGVLR